MADDCWPIADDDGCGQQERASLASCDELIHNQSFSSFPPFRPSHHHRRDNNNKWAREEAEVWQVCDRCCQSAGVDPQKGRSFVRDCLRRACQTHFGTSHALQVSPHEAEMLGLEWSPLVRGCLRAENFSMVRFLVRLFAKNQTQACHDFLLLWDMAKSLEGHDSLPTFFPCSSS